MEGYNGYKNYETWNANLWVCNEEAVESELARMMRRRANPLTEKEAQEFFLEYFPNGTPDMDGVKDLFKVDWQEIANAWNEGYLPQRDA